MKKFAVLFSAVFALFLPFAAHADEWWIPGHVINDGDNWNYGMDNGGNTNTGVGNGDSSNYGAYNSGCYGVGIGNSGCTGLGSIGYDNYTSDCYDDYRIIGSYTSIGAGNSGCGDIGVCQSGNNSYGVSTSCIGYPDPVGAAEAAAEWAVGQVMPLIVPILTKVEECDSSVDALATCLGAGQTVQGLNDTVLADAGTLAGLILNTEGQAFTQSFELLTNLESQPGNAVSIIQNDVLLWLTNSYIPNDLYPALGLVYGETALFLNTTWTWATGINQYPLPAQFPPYPGGANPAASTQPARQAQSAAAVVLQ